jgi:hypothetical protein
LILALRSLFCIVWWTIIDPHSKILWASLKYVKLCDGRCKFELFVVFVVYISEFSINSSINCKHYQGINWKVSVSIFSDLKISVHESLFTAPTIIWTGFFFFFQFEYTHTMSSVSTKIKPCDITEWKKRNIPLGLSLLLMCYAVYSLNIWLKLSRGGGGLPCVKLLRWWHCIWLLDRNVYVWMHACVWSSPLQFS